MMGDPALEASLQKAEELKSKIHKSTNIFTDPEALKCELELRKIYRSILFQDLDFALKHNVEEHLWKSGFKVSIDLGRKMNPDGFLVASTYGRKKSEAQIKLENCLRTGAKFYEKLLLEICATFDFNLAFLSELFKVHEVYDVKTWEEMGYKKPEKRALILICQNCLVHIGNCLRYEVEYDRAYPFYVKAIELNPLSGHAHNQMGLLHSYQANLVPCLYHYVRAIATPYPYFKARGNMSVNLAERAEGYQDMGYMGPMGEIRIPPNRIPSFTKYGHVFLVVMGCLRMASAGRSILGALVRHLLRSLEAFVANDVRGSVDICCDSLIRMFTMSIFVLQDAGKGFPPLEGQRIFKADPKVTREVVLDLVAGTLEVLLKRLPDLNLEKIVFFRGLPTIKLTLDWIRTEPRVLKERAFESRPQIWSSLCKVLDKFGDVKNYFEGKEEQFRLVPLPEDRELEGFTVLEPALSELRFVNRLTEEEPEVYDDPAIKFGFLRAHRLLKFGEWLKKRTNFNFTMSSDLSGKKDGAIVQLDAMTSGVLDAIFEQQLAKMNLGQRSTPQSSRPTAGTGTTGTTGNQGRVGSNGVSEESFSESNKPANGHRSSRKRTGRTRKRSRRNR